MNVVMTEHGGLIEVQGTAEGATFSQEELTRLLALAARRAAALAVQKVRGPLDVEPEEVRERAPVGRVLASRRLRSQKAGALRLQAFTRMHQAAQRRRPGCGSWASTSTRRRAARGGLRPPSVFIAVSRRGSGGRCSAEPWPRV